MVAKIRTEIMRLLLSIADKTNKKLNILIDEEVGDNRWIETELVETFQHSDRTTHHRRYKVNITIKYEED